MLFMAIEISSPLLSLGASTEERQNVGEMIPNTRQLSRVNRKNQVGLPTGKAPRPRLRPVLQHGTWQVWGIYVCLTFLGVCDHGHGHGGCHSFSQWW